MRSISFLVIFLLTYTAWPALPHALAGAAESASIVFVENTYRSILRMKIPVGREIAFITEKDGVSTENPETDPVASGVHVRHPAAARASKTRIIELVFDEFDIFTGLRNTFRDLEHQLDDYCRQMKLKGGINFIADDSEELKIRENVQLDGNFILRVKEALGRKGLRILLPDRIDWSIHSDLSGRYVIGELEIGEYLFLDGSLGEDRECRMIFEINF